VSHDFGNTLQFQIQLNQAFNCIETSNVANITNVNSLISAVTLRCWGAHVTEGARIRAQTVIANPDGGATYLWEGQAVQTQVIPNGTTGKYPIVLTNFNRPMRAMMLVFQTTQDYSTQYDSDPGFWTGPSYVQGATT
jgi:hypothetical protein